MARSKRSSLLLLAALLSGVAAPVAVGAWEIVGPETVRAASGPGPQGLTYIAADGEHWTLITTVSDPEISNRGAGDFFPAERVWVAEALAALDERLLELLDARIVLLPYPRRGLLRSSCNGRTIYLSPGVRPLSRAQVHGLLYHEIGHLLHRQILPDSDRQGWLAFEAVLRASRVPPEACLQPHECFAECFRVLFGTPEARSIRPIGSEYVRSLWDRKELREFFEVLIAADRKRLHCDSVR